jgi:hypothetical protein
MNDPLPVRIIEEQQTIAIHLLCRRQVPSCEDHMISSLQHAFGSLGGVWGDGEENSLSVGKEKGHVRKVG